MCVTVKQEVRQSTLPFMGEKSCFTLQRSCLSQTVTRSRSVRAARPLCPLDSLHGTLTHFSFCCVATEEETHWKRYRSSGLPGGQNPFSVGHYQVTLLTLFSGGSKDSERGEDG